MTEISDAKETLNYYRDAADVAERKATTATDPKIRQAYFGIQRTWEYLAEKLEQDIALRGDNITMEPVDDIFFPPGRDIPNQKAR